MSMQNNSKLPNIVKGLLDIIYGLLVFSCAALALLIVLSPLLLKRIGIPLTASVPVSIGSTDTQQFGIQISGAVQKGIHHAFVDQAEGILKLETDNWRYIIPGYLGKLLIGIGLAYTFYLIRAVLGDVIQGDPFSVMNTERIRRIGIIVLVLSFAHPVIQFISANQILQRIHTEPGINLPAPFDVEFLLASLMILLLAQIWSYGLELKRDQELTI